jgi:hypothetical protein
MPVSEARGDQVIHGKRGKLGARVAEQPLGRRVGHDDPAFPVGDQHRVGGEVE